MKINWRSLWLRIADACRSIPPRIAYAALAVCVMSLSLDILGIGGAGDDKESAYRVPENTQQAWQALRSEQAAFLEREYDSVVAEIRGRLEHEQALFILKFTLVGATLYLIFQSVGRQRSESFERTEITALVAWAAVIAAALTDLRLMSNQNFVMTLGGWVRAYEELRLGTAAVHLGWEAYLADKLLSLPAYPALRVNSGILTALLFCVTAGIFILEPHKLKRRTVLVARAGGLLSIGLMTLASWSLRLDLLAACLYTVCGTAAAILTLKLIPLPRAAAPCTIHLQAANDPPAAETVQRGEA